MIGEALPSATATEGISRVSAGRDPAMPAQRGLGRESDRALSSGAGHARGPDGEDEPTLAEAYGLDLEGVATARQRDQVACVDIAWQDVVLHA